MLRERTCHLLLLRQKERQMFLQSPWSQSPSSSSSSRSLSCSIGSTSPAKNNSHHLGHHHQDLHQHLNLHLHLQQQQQQQRRSYFTNGDAMKKNDPYAILGLNWGDGATTSDIKHAFREKARALHPDVNKVDAPEKAIQKFQALQQAFEQIMKSTTTGGGGSSLGYVPEEWRAAIWRQSDRIAMDRTDVAGALRKRPAQPAKVSKEWQYGGRNLLGHPSGKGIYHSNTRGEYLADGSNNGSNNSDNKKRPSSVGRGLNKWVTPKEFIPWNPEGEK